MPRRGSLPELNTTAMVAAGRPPPQSAGLLRENGTYQYWFGTHPCSIGYSFATGPYPSLVLGVRGQLEEGEGGLVHYQILVRTGRPVRRTQLSALFPGTHWEPSRSERARDYVWKEDTRVGDPFEWGDTLPARRNSPTDWEEIRRRAKRGELELIPPDVYIRYYCTLRRIGSDFIQPVFREVVVKVILTNLGLLGDNWIWQITRRLGRGR
jgi:hypothetical protein